MSRRLTGLRPQTYEHPLDAQALNALQKTSGLETVVRKCNEWGFERLLRVQLTGSHLRVTPDSMPDVHDKLLAACDVLDLPKVPDLYIAAGDDLNAFTAGVERPLIVLNAGTVDRLTEQELLFVLAHEVGHIIQERVLGEAELHARHARELARWGKTRQYDTSRLQHFTLETLDLTHPDYPLEALAQRFEELISEQLMQPMP